MIQDIGKKNEDITTQFEHFNRTSNIFSIFKHEGHEDANSNILAWLLDANEKHGLKDAFIMALIEKLNEGQDDAQGREHHIDSTAFNKSNVYREYAFTDEDKKARRIDILIKTENSTNILVIENKIYSSEHTGQLLAYMNHINKVYGEKSAVTFVKLSPCGDLPSQNISKTRGPNGWKVLSYADILSCLLQMQHKTMPLDTRTIISNYIDYLRFSLCVDKEIMDVVKDTDVEAREKAKERLCDEIGEVLPKNITTHSEEKSGVYYLRFTTPQIDTYMKNNDPTQKDNDPTQAAQNTSKKAPFWDGHSYAFEFIITDSDLTFQLCFLEEDNKTNSKNLEDKFVYDKHEQIQPRNKTSRWIVLRKESFIFNGNNWDGLSKFIRECQEYLKRWEQEVCSKDSGIEFKPLSSPDNAYKESFIFNSNNGDGLNKFISELQKHLESWEQKVCSEDSGIEFKPLDSYKVLFDSTLEFKAKYVANFRYYLANKIYAILDKYYKDNLISYFASNEKQNSINIKFFTKNQQEFIAPSANCNGCRNDRHEDQCNTCAKFWEKGHTCTREIIIKDKEAVAQFVIKCKTSKEAKEIKKKYVLWCQQTIKFENQTTEDIVAQIKAYIKNCTEDNQCRTLTPAFL